MKKFIITLIMLSMGSVAVAYAAETTPASRSFIFGDSAHSAASLNQVLVLLTGKMAFQSLQALPVLMG